MYLRESRQKRADGSVLTHLQLAENVWDPEQRRARVQIVYNCGRSDDPASTERLRRLARSVLRRCAPEEIVAVLAGRKFDFDVERALFAMVAIRALAPASKLYCYTQWLQEDVHLDGAAQLSLQHLYRAMDVLEAQREAIEEALYYRLADLLNLDVELVFYDTTSLHFEVDEAGAGGERDEVHGSVAAGRKTYQALRRRGHAKNGCSDVPQIVIGLAVTRDGFPVRHWIFPGNTVDVTTVAKVEEELKAWQLSRCVFVGDAGMVSKANLETLARAGGKYIVAMPVHRGGEVAVEVLTRPGRYQQVAENLAVKDVTVGDGERRRRYVVCHNPQEAERQRRHREQVLAELSAEIESLATQRGHTHGKRVCELRASGRYGNYLRFTKTGRPQIDAARIAALAKLDGKFVVHSNDDTLTAADLALGCLPVNLRPSEGVPWIVHARRKRGAGRRLYDLERTVGAPPQIFRR
jgi:hypothetical protein